MTLIRDWLGVTSDDEKERVVATAEEQRRRLARIDAGLPVSARRVQVYPHPNRRASDRQ